MQKDHAGYGLGSPKTASRAMGWAALACRDCIKSDKLKTNLIFHLRLGSF